VTGGLCLTGDNTQFLAYEGVHKGGLAHVGVAYDVDESCFVHVEKNKKKKLKTKNWLQQLPTKVFSF
jgi:hypothetical protein